MNEKDTLVVVLSRNYSTGLSVIRSLGAAGFTVDLVASARVAGDSKIAACSKYVRKSYEIVTPKIKEDESDEELVGRLLTYKGKWPTKPVLFPADDYTTSIMDKNRSLLSDIFLMPTIAGGGDGCLTESMDKTYQASLARKVGLLAPKEWVFSLENEIVIPDDMVYPCFCKPIESVTGFKKEMARCNNSEQLQAHLEKLQYNHPFRSILIQEFLNIDQEIDLSGVCIDSEVIIPAIIRKENVAKFERGVTLAGTVVPVEELGDLKEKVEKLMSEIRYIGMFDLELNIVGDKVYFNEVNLRSGGPNYAYFKSGVNLPALFVKKLLNMPTAPEDEKIKEFHKLFIYEKVAWEDHLHGHMTKKQLKERIKAADITLLHNEEDPAPSKYFMRAMAKSVRYKKYKDLKKKIKKLIKAVKNLLWPAYTVYADLKHRLQGYPQFKKENKRPAFDKSPRVMVAGRNYCSNLCMARSLGEAGYDVEVLRIYQWTPQKGTLARVMRPDTYSKYIKAYYSCVSYRRTKAIVNKLKKIADPYNKMLLIPADDLVAYIADEYMDVLSEYYIMPNINGTAGEIGRLMSKEVQKDLAKQAGLPVINSCVIRTVRGRFVIPKSVTYPCFIKPNISKNSSKSKMCRCDNEKELSAALIELSKKKDVEFLVEDFVDIQKEYSLLGVSTKDGAVAPGYFVAEKGGHDEHRGVTLVGRILPCQKEQEFIDKVVKFVASLGFDGLFDVDLLKTNDGKLYFIEVNMRFGASGYAVTKAGVNLPAMFADYMFKGIPIDLNCKINTPDITFISEKIMLDEYVNGYLSKDDMAKLMESVDVHFVYDKDDMGAYNHFKKYYPMAKRLKAKVEREKKKLINEEA